MAKVSFLFAFILTMIFSPGFVFAGIVDTLNPGEWYEVPGSNMSAVTPNPTPPGYVGPAAVMSAWSGAAYDTTRDRLVVWGGGHGDYGGNEVYVFDVNSLAWSRIWGPSPNIPAVGGSCTETYSDGNPVSKHTYDGLAYIPTIDKFWSQGGSRYCGPGGGSNATWNFDFNTLTWTRKSDAPNSMLGVVSAYDQVTGHVFHQGVTKFSEYDPVADTWTVHGSKSDGWWEDRLTGAIDPERRLFVAVGQGYVRVWDLNTWQFSEKSTSGGGQVVNTGAPGFVYDPVLKKFVGWGSGTSVYSLDPTTWTWTEHPAAPTNTVTPSQSSGTGTFKRFQYIPSKNAYILVNSISGNVYFYKLSSSSSHSITDTTAPTSSITSPATGATVSGTVTVAANASDDTGVAGVVFKLDGAPIGAEDTTSPYSVSWDTTTAADGSHSLTAFARDAAGNTVTSASVAVTVSNSSSGGSSSGSGAWVDIPLRTWVARPLPSSGQGPTGSGHIKHLRMTHNPLDGRIYVLGGDYTGPIGYDSGRNEIYSYGVADDSWRLEHPYCAPGGSVQPSHPDEVGWVFDSNRNIFWMFPGYMGADQGHCSSTLIRNEIMTYDPSTGVWDYPNRTTDGLSTAYNKFAQYDPVEDTVIRFFGYNSAPKVAIYDIKTDSWSIKTYNYSASLGEEYSAIDLENRVIYIIDGLAGKLYKYDMDARTLTYLTDTPVVTGKTDLSMPVWDSVNNVLLWSQIFDYSGVGMKFHVYHPDINKWDANLPLTQPDGLEVRGNNAVFDPSQNVLIILGGSGGVDPNPYMFIYRYGNGSGGSTGPDTTIPSPPSSLFVDW